MDGNTIFHVRNDQALRDFTWTIRSVTDIYVAKCCDRALVAWWKKLRMEIKNIYIDLIMQIFDVLYGFMKNGCGISLWTVQMNKRKSKSNM